MPARKYAKWYGGTDWELWFDDCDMRVNQQLEWSIFLIEIVVNDKNCYTDLNYK